MRMGWFLVVALAAAVCFAQDAPPKKLVLITQSKGFVHPVTTRPVGKPSLVEQTFNDLAERTRLFTVEASQDASILTPEKLKNTDIVVFYTTETLPMKPEDLDAFVKNGGCFLGIHSASDTFHGNPVYLNLIDGEFVEHPWTQEVDVTIKVLDPNHPAAKPWGEGASFKEEIYHQKPFNAEKVRVLIGLDMEKTALKKPYFVPIAWCKEYGKGKVFYTSLGHRPDMWRSEKYQDHLVGAIEWLIGKSPADSTPNPDVSAREDAIAKKIAPPEPPASQPATQPATRPAKKPKSAQVDADAPTLPKVPSEFRVSVFARAPDLKSPASIAAEGFASERIIARGAAAGDYTGFVTRETADEVQLRDPSGKATVVRKADITKRMPMPGSMMPEGLVDSLGLDDFASLLAYLQAVK